MSTRAKTIVVLSPRETLNAKQKLKLIGRLLISGWKGCGCRGIRLWHQDDRIKVGQDFSPDLVSKLDVKLFFFFFKASFSFQQDEPFVWLECVKIKNVLIFPVPDNKASCCIFIKTKQYISQNLLLKKKFIDKVKLFLKTVFSYSNTEIHTEKQVKKYFAGRIKDQEYWHWYSLAALQWLLRSSHTQMMTIQWT